MTPVLLKDKRSRTGGSRAALVGPPASLLIMAAFAYRRTGSARAALGLAAVALFLGVAMAALPRTMRWILPPFRWLASAGAWAVSHLLLAAVFFGPLTVTGLIARAFGYDPMRCRRERTATTYWIERDPAPKQTETYFQQF